MTQYERFIEIIKCIKPAFICTNSETW